MRFPDPFGGLRGNVYDDHLRLIGKRLPISINWTFFARCYGWGATSDYRFKIGDFGCYGCGRGSPPPAVRVWVITPGKFAKTQMLNTAFGWLLDVKFPAFLKTTAKKLGEGTTIHCWSPWGPVFSGPYGCCVYAPDTRIVLLDAENRTIISSFVFTKHLNVTEWRTDTDGRTDRILWLLQRSALRAMRTRCKNHNMCLKHAKHFFRPLQIQICHLIVTSL